MPLEYRLADHLAYLRRLLRHKRLVLEEGRKLGVPMPSLWLHDLSKFLPDEWFAGVAFYRSGIGNDEALRKHYARNQHHPQGWQRGVKTFPMSERFRLEMLADWRAMARERGNEIADWYGQKGHTIPLHPETRLWVEQMIFGHVEAGSETFSGNEAAPVEGQNEP